MYSFQDLTHSVFDESTRTHLYGKLNFIKTVSEFFQALATLREKYAQDVEALVANCKYKAHEDRPQYGSTLLNLWDAVLHIVDLDAKCHSEFAQSLLKRLAVTLSDFCDTKTQQYDRLFAHRATVLHIIQQNTHNTQENYRVYCDVYARQRAAPLKTTSSNKAAVLRAHNDYVLQLQFTNSMLDELHYNEIPQIMRDLDETDFSSSTIFSETADAFVAASINFAVHQKLRYDTIQRDECPQVNLRLDTTNFIKHCETEIGRPDCFGRERWTLDYRNPTAVKDSDVLGNDIINDKLVEADLRDRLNELQRYHAELSGNVESSNNALRSFENMIQSYTSTIKPPSGSQIPRSTSTNRFTPILYDRKVLELQMDICRKSCDMRVTLIELAGVRKQIELLNGPGKLCDPATATATATAIQLDRRYTRERVSTANGGTSPPTRLTDDASTLSLNSSVPDRGARDKAETPSKLPGMSMWKQAVSRWRKNGDQKTNKSKTSSASRQAEPDQIDPIYSLLRCANTLPRPTAVNSPAPLKTQYQQPNSPTKQSPAATAPSGFTTPNTAASNYQSGRQLSNSVTRQGSIRSIQNGTSDDESVQLPQSASSSSSAIRTKALTGSVQRMKLSNMRSISVDDASFPANNAVCGKFPEVPSQSLNTFRRPSSAGPANKDGLPSKPQLIDQGNKSNNESRVESQLQSQPQQSSQMTGSFTTNLLTVSHASQMAAKCDRKSRAKNFSRKPSSSFDVPDNGDTKEIYISISSADHNALHHTLLPPIQSPTSHRRGSSSGLPISTLTARAISNERKRSENSRVQQYDRDTRYENYQKDPAGGSRDLLVADMSYQSRRRIDVPERCYREGSSPQNSNRVSPSRRTTSRSNLIRSNHHDYEQDSDNNQW